MRIVCGLIGFTAVLGCCCLDAAVHRIHVVERTDVLDGQPFGEAGPYERIAAKVHFQVDPAAEANQIISDIDLAPVNEDGLVEFSADLYVLKPTDPAKGNGTVLFDVLNRGNKVMLAQFNRARGSSDPKDPEHFGDGFLMEQGFYLVWLAWQFDVPRNPGLMRIDVPVAKNKDGSPITGIVRADFVPSKKATRHSLADRNHIAYPVIDPGNPRIHLSVRDDATGTRLIVPREEWRFSDDGTAIEKPSGFEPGRIYQVSYHSENPALVGLGLAGVRDLISFLKYNEPRRNTLLASDARVIERAIGFGSSQSGRFLRTLLYYGFNRDANGKQVFDGVLSHVAGAGRGSFNHRFAQPSRDAAPHMNFFYPTDVFPFTDLPQTDPKTGLSGGILERAMADKVVPKIFYTNTSYEYWGRAASLTHATLDGKRDVEIPPTTRIYFLRGTQHGSRRFPPSKSNTQNLTNPASYNWPMRALLVALNHWITDGVEPPPSRYPRIAEGELVPVEALAFPKIPGIRIPSYTHLAHRADYGPDFYSKGIVRKDPPAIGEPFKVLVPQVGSDGNELSGIAQPIQQAPLGTFAGWNHRAPEIGAPEKLADLIGSYIPFPRTREERQKTGDPRPSVAELYENRQEYDSRIRQAAEQLAAEGYLLESDIDAAVAEGAAQWQFVMGGADAR